MSALKKKDQINLLPIDKFAAGIAGRTLNWLLSTFRIIVIIIEMVVMTAFLSRFWLDAKNSDLTDEMKQKQVLLEASKQFEDEFNAAREKIAIYNNLSNSNIQFSQSLNNIPSLLPEGIILKSLSLSSSGVNLDGSAQTANQIAQLMANLETNEEYKNPTLNQLSLDQETQLLIFKINIP